jgi:hypothetical protein
VIADFIDKRKILTQWTLKKMAMTNKLPHLLEPWTFSDIEIPDISDMRYLLEIYNTLLDIMQSSNFPFLPCHSGGEVFCSLEKLNLRA